MKLEARKVEEIFLDCLFPENSEENEEVIAIDGLTAKFVFNPKKIEEYINDIKALLDELPELFKDNVGGGWSFLQACFDKHENQWGEHRNMEQLFVLGMAAGYANYVLPRQVWVALPGGVPYIATYDDRHYVDTTTPKALKELLNKSKEEGGKTE